MTAQSILLITLSNIGDAIMTTPVLAALHARYPEARIDLVCDVRSSALFESCPYIGQLFKRDKKSGWTGYWQLICLLRKKRYDIIVDLRTDFLAYFLRAARKLKKLPNESTLHMHSVKKHMAVVQALAVNTVPQAELWASQCDEQVVATRFPLSGRWLAIGLGANFDGKIWPVERYAAVVNALSDQIDGVVLLGSKADTERAQQFITAVKLPIYNACGHLSLPQSYALLRQCYFFLGNDSGLGHMAAAASVPTLTLFGPGSPVRYLPWSPHASFIQDANQNILGITVQQVTDTLQALLIQIIELSNQAATTSIIEVQSLLSDILEDNLHKQ